MKPILVMKELKSGSVASMAVPQKGAQPDWVPERCAKWIDGLGWKKVIIKHDQEVSIEAWAKAVAKFRDEETQTAPEESPMGESMANGAAEQTVQEVKGLIRTLVASLEDRLKQIS